MKKRRRLLIVVGLVFLALVIWQVSSANKRRDARAKVTLPDVGTVYFERAEYGAEFVYGDTTERFIYGIVGEKIMQKLGMRQPVVVKHHSPALCVWLTLDQPKSKLPRHGYFSLADENGYFAGENYTKNAGEYAPNITAIAIPFERIPRGSRMLKLRWLLPNDNWRHLPVAEFSFANPLPPAAASPMATGSLPMKRSTNGLEITLQRLAFGVGADRKFLPAKTNQMPETLAAFVIRKGGIPVKDWAPSDVRMKDSFGTGAGSGSRGNTRRGTTNFFQFSSGLWPDTNGVRFTFEFTREKTAKFATNELLVLKGVAVPTPTNVTELHYTTNILGHDVTIVGLFGKRGKIAGHQRSFSSDFSLEVKVDPPLLDKRLDLLRIADEKGREGRQRGMSWSRTSGRYGIGLDFHNMAKEVDLTLAVHPSVYAEFTVLPEVLKP